MPPRRPPRAAAALAACAAALAATAAAPAAAAASRGRYDPCTEPGLATKSRPLYLGLALWPGAPVDAWPDGASPCPPPPGAPPSNGSAAIAAAGGVLAPYALRVDSIAALHVPASVLTALLKEAEAAGRPPQVTGALFRGGRVRSPPRVLASADPDATVAAGLVSTLVADVVVSGGALARIDWVDLGCVGCGGRGGGACIQTHTGQASCAAPVADCAAARDTSETGAACATTVYVGFSGADRSRAALASGGQLRSLRAGSAAALADAVAVRVKAILAGAATGAPPHATPRPDPPADDDDAAPSDLKLPLAGADTDWREFRARLVAATEPTAAAPPADGDAAVDGDPDAAAVAPGTAAGWAHPLLGGPEPGAVLVAHPLLFTAAQTYFHQAVVLLISHGPDGSAGLILNKPTQYTLAEVGGVDALLPACGGSTLHLGGDVERASVHVVHGTPSLPGAVEIVPGVCVGGVEAAAAAANAGAVAPDAFQWFTGYCGWAPGQLEAEVAAGVWFVAAVDAPTLRRAGRPGGPRGAALWHALLDRMGGEHAALSAAVRGDADERIMRLVRGEGEDAGGGDDGGEGDDA